MLQSMRPLFIYHHTGMREGTKAIIVVISDIFPIDSSTKEPRNDLSMIVYKKNIKYESVVLEITTKNSPTTIFPSCVTVRTEAVTV